MFTHVCAWTLERENPATSTEHFLSHMHMARIHEALEAIWLRIILQYSFSRGVSYVCEEWQVANLNGICRFLCQTTSSVVAATMNNIIDDSNRYPHVIAIERLFWIKLYN